MEGQETAPLVNLHLYEPPAVATMGALSDVEEAKLLVIDSPMMAEYAGDLLVALKQKADTVEAERKAMVDPINKAHAGVQAFFKRFSEPLAEAIRITKEKYVAYDTEQRRIAAEEQRKRDEEAAQQRARLAAEAAAAQASADKEATKLREDAAAAAAAGDAVKAATLEVQAEAAQEQGATAAMEIAVQAASTVAAVVAPAAPKVAGISAPKANWKFLIEDPSKIPAEYLMPDEKKIGGYGKLMKEKASIPGVRFFNDASVSVRAKPTSH